METLAIGIVGMSTFPCPSPLHTGDVVIIDLARTLEEMGHEVDLYAPDGSWKPLLGHQYEMLCSWGSNVLPSGVCEQICYNRWYEVLQDEDVVHDFSQYKRITENLLRADRRNVISTLLGGVWTHPNPPLNIVVWSEAMRQRGLRGATDYENTPTPEMGGHPHPPIKDAHVVYGGVDTEYYSPGGPKEDFFLWMNRWHRAKGYHVAIELARRTGIPLVLAGNHPDAERFEHERQCALEAQHLAKDLPNVRFEWLPPDPDHHDAKRELYRRAEALLYPIQFCEPFGLSQVEALACGTPVIGINFGSVPEVIESGLTGYVCENSIEDLANACEAIDAISPIRSREEAVRRFDRRVMARAYLDEYRKVLDGEVWGAGSPRE